MADVFISAAPQDRQIARQLGSMLEAKGKKVFSDISLVTGMDYSAAIEEALADAKAVVVLLSRNSNRSRWVEKELRTALESGHSVIPVLMDEEAMNNWVWPLISDRHAIRMDSPQQLEKVLDEVTKAVGVTDPSPSAFRSIAGSRWWAWLIGVLSAVLSALVTWYATK